MNPEMTILQFNDKMHNMGDFSTNFKMDSTIYERKEADRSAYGTNPSVKCSMLSPS